MKNPLALLLCFAVLMGAGCLGEKVELSRWPDGHRAAVVLSFEVEQASASDIARAAQTLRLHGANGTFFVVAGYYADEPGALEPLRGFEVANKGWIQGEWSPGYEGQRRSVKQAHTWLEQAGFRPAGFRAPFLRADEETLAVLSDLGYRYDSSKTGALPWEHNGVLEIPLTVSYDPFWSDDVEEYLPLLYLAFENTYSEGGLFLFYTYPEHMDERYEVLLKHLSRRDVWFASAGEVAEWWRKREMVSLSTDGDVAVIRNNGPATISGLTLKTEKGDIPLPDIEGGASIRVRI